MNECYIWIYYNNVYAFTLIWMSKFVSITKKKNSRSHCAIIHHCIGKTLKNSQDHLVFVVILFTLRVFARNLLREEIAEEILSVLCFDVWLGSRTLAFRPPTKYKKFLFENYNLAADFWYKLWEQINFFFYLFINYNTITNYILLIYTSWVISIMCSE